jgi:LysM repeat protein
VSLFDRMFGHDASIAQATPETEQRFEELKGKYASVVRLMEQSGVRLSNVHVENNKLFLKGTAPSQEVKDKIWDEIKRVDPNYADLAADIEAAPSTPVVDRAPGGSKYVVKSGDTLSKIAHRFYGDENEYMHIFDANRDTLRDPSEIRPGQELTIPPK